MIRGGYWGGAWGLSWAGAWGEAWLLLNQPYQELSLKGQVFVRSYLTRIHSVEIAEQIVAVAALNNISVIDAEVVVTVSSSEDRREVVKKRVQRKIEPPKSDDRLDRKKPIELAAKHVQPEMYAKQGRSVLVEKESSRQLVVCHNVMRVDLINCAKIQFMTP